ncbi:MAG: gamma-glutamyl-gamma-aminobutyrate hydrolase family protein [Bacillota bacterium]
MLPVIGLTSAWSTETYPVINKVEGFAYVDKLYCDVIFLSGGFPVILPTPFEDEGKYSDEVFDRVNGLLITGGGGGFSDEKGSLYETSPELSKQQASRYKYESFLIIESWKRNMPVLGICRGHQMIAEVLGGCIQREFIKGHSPGPYLNINTLDHYVSLCKNTKLKSICGCTDWLVNSYHIQVVEKVPPGFRISANSHEGFIESIEASDKSFFAGVQFHPEKMYNDSFEAQRLFQAFINASSKNG